MFYTLMTSRSVAQNTDTLVYRYQSVRSVGLGFPALNYSLLSPLNHSGYSLNIHSTRFIVKPKHLTQFHMLSELGLLYNYANDSYITTLGFRGGWSRHWYVTDRSSPLRLLLGGDINAGVDIYLKEENTNNPLAYFFNFSVSPSVLVKYRFNMKKTKLELGQQIDFPAGSLVSSSGYSTMLPHGFTEKNASFFEALRFVSFGDLKKCIAVTSLDITPSLDRRQKCPVFRVSYMFSGMKYNNGDLTIKTADHVILFGAIFHLFR